MGFRFRKSFKIAPGVKLNIGKKSMGISIGGKYGGISHNTKTGTRARITAYGTGLSYSTKLGGKKMKSTKVTANSTSKTNGGCLMTCLKGCLYIMLIPFYWIYGIIWFLFFRKKIDDPEQQKKATTKYGIFTAVSVLLFTFSIFGNSDEPTEPTAIVAESETSTENDIFEEEIVGEIPRNLPTEQLSEAEIETTEEESSSVEEITEGINQSSEPETEIYTQPEEPVTEPEEQSETEIVDNSIESNTTTQSTEANNNPTTSETTQTIPEQPATPVVDAPSQSSTTMVWIDDTAAKYHKKNGCGMNNAYQVTLEEAQAKGKEPCGRCYK